MGGIDLERAGMKFSRTTLDRQRVERRKKDRMKQDMRRGLSRNLKTHQDPQGSSLSKEPKHIATGLIMELK